MEVPYLETPRLWLRSITAADVPDILPFSFYDGLQLFSEADVLHKLERIATDIRAGQSLHWGLERKNLPGLIGTVGFYRGFRNYTGEIGYVLHPSFQGLGYMQEAVMKAVTYGFDVLQLRQVAALTSEDNLPSQKLLEKAGFLKVVSGNGNYLKFTIRNKKFPEVTL